MKSVHCQVGQEKKILLIDNTDTVASVVEKALQLNTKSEQNVIPRLYDPEGFLLPIGPSIEENTSDDVYKLNFVAGIIC